jgi:RHS repeat-associated protein
VPGLSGAAEAYVYSDFGAPAGGSYLAYQFAGYRYDSETGLYQVGARYYSPTLGRFLQTDPIGTSGGNNLYAYVNNDPVNLADPTGLSPEEQQEFAMNSGDPSSAAGPSTNATPSTYLILEGQSGPNHNVAGLFDLAAQTYKAQLAANGDSAVIVSISTEQDLATALTSNGEITGGVVYFGHAGGVETTSGAVYSALFISPGNTLTSRNIGNLSSDNLAPGISITINACNAGTSPNGAATPIAQLIANQLNETTYAYNAPMFFSNNPSTNNSSQVSHISSSAPVYMLPEHGASPIAFTPKP